MNKLLAILPFLFLLSQRVHPQVLPAEGSKLNYRLIGFRFPIVPGASGCKIEIAAGKFSDEDSFKNNIVKTLQVKKNKVIEEVPAFGAAYTWRYTYTANGKPNQSKLYHFMVAYFAQADTSNIRFRISVPATKYKDDYVFLDGNGALYDMDGQPVWALPNENLPIANKNLNINFWISDLKISPQNTITFLARDLVVGNPAASKYQAFEINYDGEVLWKAPDNGKVSGDSVERYHHEFTRHSNGHYMVLGSEINWKYPFPGTALTDSNAGKKGYGPVEFGTIMEYDESGEVVWSWKSSQYFLKEDPDFNPAPKKTDTTIDFAHGKIDFVNPNKRWLENDVHENAFFFDENKKVIYLSFKNVSRILKLKYPEGTVLNAYGPVEPWDGGGGPGINLFCHQHSCRISQDGYLYLFDNNLCDNKILPKIEMFQEPATEKDTLKKTWEFLCPIGAGNHGKFTSGGNVIEMPDRCMFVNTSSDYNNVFIVSRDKNILWSGFPERWNKAAKKWAAVHQYRASIVTRQQLDDLIWHSEKAD